MLMMLCVAGHTQCSRIDAGSTASWTKSTAGWYAN